VQPALQRCPTDHHQKHNHRQIAVLPRLLHNRGYLQLNVRISQRSATNHEYPPEVDYIGLLALILKSELDVGVSRLLVQLGDLDGKWLEGIYLEGRCFGDMKHRDPLGDSTFDGLVVEDFLVLANRTVLYVRRCPTSAT
jgi:hypothetical protein